MKKLNYLLIFLIGFAQFSQVCARMPKVSPEHIDIVKKRYAQEVRTAKVMRAACILSAASVVGYLAYEWLNPSDKVSLEFSKEDVAKIKDNVVAYFENLKIAKTDPISWAKWFNNTIFSIPSMVVGLASTVVSFGIHERARQVGIDLFTQRTMLWFAERRTALAQTLSDMYQAAETYKRGLITKVELNQSIDASVALLVEDIEKILGYGEYALMQLPAQPLYQRNFGKNILNRIEILTNQFITDIEEQSDNTAAILRYTQDSNMAIKSFSALENNQRNNLSNSAINSGAAKI